MSALTAIGLFVANFIVVFAIGKASWKRGRKLGRDEGLNVGFRTGMNFSAAVGASEPPVEVMAAYTAHAQTCTECGPAFTAAVDQAKAEQRYKH